MHRLRSRTFSIRRSRQNDYDTIPAHKGLTRSCSLISAKPAQPDVPPPLPPPRKVNLLKVGLAQRQMSRSMDLQDLNDSPLQWAEDGALSDCHSDCSDIESFPILGTHQEADQSTCMDKPPVITVSDEPQDGDSSVSLITSTKSQSMGELPTVVSQPEIEDYSDYIVMESTGSSRWSLSQPSPEPEDTMDSGSKCTDCRSKSADKITARLEDLTTKLNTLTKLFEQDRTTTVPSVGDSVCGSDSSASVRSAVDQNREMLATLDCDQVLCLLDAMNLRQYKESFQQEQVNGEILLEFDEEILESELHIGSRIHRIKLTKLITGKLSVHDYLKRSN